jgi:hypothetical protein
VFLSDDNSPIPERLSAFSRQTTLLSDRIPSEIGDAWALPSPRRWLLYWLSSAIRRSRPRIGQASERNEPPM